MTTPETVTTVTSSISIVIAFAALITSQRAQRANYKLQLELAKRSGRLRQIKLLYPDKRERIGHGFKVINGPDEVTVSRAILYLTYRIYRSSTIRWIDEKLEFTIRPHEFKILGISGKDLGFRLAPNDEEEWRFPYDLPELSDNAEGANRCQQIELRFEVTASENTKCSEPYTLMGTSPALLFAEQARNTGYVTLEPVLLGVLAQDAARTLRSNGISGRVLSELEELALNIAVPTELQNWLVDAWERAGSFSKESTEALARTLFKLRPPDPDPDVLATYARVASVFVSPATP